jgi:hypothetical protein
VNHGRADRSVDDHDFEQVPRTVRPKHEEATRIVAGLVGDKGMFDRVLAVEWVHAVAARRRLDLHMANIVLRKPKVQIPDGICGRPAHRTDR